MPRLSTIQAAAIVASVLLYASAIAANPAHVHVAGPLQSQPQPSAPATGALKSGALVDILERKGFWAHVRGGAQTGWLKLGRLSVDSGGSGNEIAALASGRTGSNNVVSASGGRGLDATDLARATPDTASVAALVRSAASEAAAEQFAKSGRLKTRHIGYMRESASDTRRVRDERKQAPRFNPCVNPGGACDRRRAGLAQAQSLSDLLGKPSKDNQPDLGGILGQVKDLTGGQSANDEARSGETIAATVFGAARPWRNPSIQSYVNLVGRNLARQVERKDVQWRFAVLDTPSINAMAFPGGIVVVTRGLYALLASEDELAAVLAHEIAHVNRRHQWKVIQQQKLVALAGDAVTRGDPGARPRWWRTSAPS